MNEQKKLSVINLGLQRFYDALLAQGVQAAQLQWRPPRTDAANGCPALSDALFCVGLIAGAALAAVL